MVPLLSVVAAVSAGAVGAAPADLRQSLDEAVKLFAALEDEKALAAFRALLARSPPDQIAAKAHLYVGLILCTATQVDDAKSEFRRAIKADPAIELPSAATPKAHLAFEDAQHELLETELEAHRPEPPKPAQAAAPVPTAVPPAALASAVEQKEPHSHTVAYVLGGATLALAVVAIYGGVQVLDYNSTVGAANKIGPTSKPTYSYDAQGSASFWAVGWPLAAGLGAAGVVGTVWTW